MPTYKKRAHSVMKGGKTGGRGEGELSERNQRGGVGQVGDFVIGRPYGSGGRLTFPGGTFDGKESLGRRGERGLPLS